MTIAAGSRPANLPRSGRVVPPLVARVREALSGERDGEARRFVLAVSGGLDSMALLRASIRAGMRGRIAAVATFDHGTGRSATAAAALVARVADANGVRCESGRAPPGTVRTEAAWRDLRHGFLRDVARRHRAEVATAHTRDDQVETVAMRILRGSGARGLAGLDADGDVVRPLLTSTRAELAAFAAAEGLAFAHDPTNDDRRYFRNRMRLELLPALCAANPGFDRWLLVLAGRAAALRRDIEALAARIPMRYEPFGTWLVDRGALTGLGAEALATLWPAVAARAGITLDRRGTARLARFTETGSTGGRVQLSGRHEVVLRRNEVALGPLGAPGQSRRKAPRRGPR